MPARRARETAEHATEQRGERHEGEHASGSCELRV
jgi:hypothetical protein